MKEFRLKAYHRHEKRLFDVVGITGLNQNDSRVQSQDTTMLLADVDVLLYTGEKDSKNNKLFESDTVEFSVKEEKKTFIRTGRIVFENAQFIIEYEKSAGVNKFSIIKVLNPEWKKCIKTGSIYDTKK